MPSNNSSTLYPSIQGSDLHHSESFWSLPTMASSPALSSQSIITNISSEPDDRGLKILVDYPSENPHYQMLEGFNEWFVITLQPKLIAIEDVWRRMEDMAAKLRELKTSDASFDVCINTAWKNVQAVMKQQGLLLSIAKIPQGGGQVEWNIDLGGDSVFHGKADKELDVLCADFFKERLAELEHTHQPCFLGRDCK